MNTINKNKVNPSILVILFSLLMSCSADNDKTPLNSQETQRGYFTKQGNALSMRFEIPRDSFPQGDPRHLLSRMSHAEKIRAVNETTPPEEGTITWSCSAEGELLGTAEIGVTVGNGSVHDAIFDYNCSGPVELTIRLLGDELDFSHVISISISDYNLEPVYFASTPGFVPNELADNDTIDLYLEGVISDDTGFDDPDPVDGTSDQEVTIIVHPPTDSSLSVDSGGFYAANSNCTFSTPTSNDGTESGYSVERGGIRADDQCFFKDSNTPIGFMCRRVCNCYSEVTNDFPGCKPGYFLSDTQPLCPYSGTSTISTPPAEQPWAGNGMLKCVATEQQQLLALELCRNHLAFKGDCADKCAWRNVPLWDDYVVANLCYEL